MEVLRKSSVAADPPDPLAEPGETEKNAFD